QCSIMSSSAMFSILRRQFSTSGALRQLVVPPTQVFGLEGRYATALYSAAVKSKKLEQVDQDLGKVSQLLKSDPRLGEFLNNPLYNKVAKSAAFAKLLTGLKVSDLTLNLFNVLGLNGRLGRSGQVLASFAIIMSAHKGEVPTEVVTARPLDSKETQELQSVLNSFAKSGQKLQVSFRVDPSIVGGMTVAIGDKFVDMSTASKIRLYHNLLKQSV
ncbi:hypothetical protein BOX15_Mlig033465g3, partial [Macrostomum lignano]